VRYRAHNRHSQRAFPLEGGRGDQNFLRLVTLRARLQRIFANYAKKCPGLWAASWYTGARSGTFRMPRSSASARQIAAYAATTAQLAPSADLTQEQRDDWYALVNAYPGRFTIDERPLLTELFRHMAVARQVAAELATLRECPLARATKAANANRRL